MPKEIYVFLILFLGLLLLTTLIAYSRVSGSTGQDPHQIDLIRRER